MLENNVVPARGRERRALSARRLQLTATCLSIAVTALLAPGCKRENGPGDSGLDGGPGTDAVAVTDGGGGPGVDGSSMATDGGGGPGVDGGVAGGSECSYSGDPLHICECDDGTDNDGDGNTDDEDIHCFGPLDDDESSFATGIPGDNEGANGSFECPFDGDSGPGNDNSACCNADPTMNATPNGCDQTGCCEIDVNGNETGEHVRAAGTCDFAPACAAGSTNGCPCSDTAMCDAGQFCVFDDDMAGVGGFCSTCEPCMPDLMCKNPCDCGEMCFSGFERPGCGGTGTCPAGVTECPGGDGDCNAAASEACVSGCCYATCPSGVVACTVNTDCPTVAHVCVTGCCVLIN